MSLPPERYRLEMEKALEQSEEPSRFFDILNAVGALEHTFPELAALREVPAGPHEYHKEGSAFRHTMMVLDEMAALRPDDQIAMLMTLAHDLGKGVTPEDELPSHPGHGNAGLGVIDSMAERLSMSNNQQQAMKDAARYHMRFHQIEELRAATIVEMIDHCSHERINQLINLIVADDWGKKPKGDHAKFFPTSRIRAAERAIEAWSGEDLIEAGYDPAEMGGENFGNLLHQKRVEKMREIET